MPCDQAVLRMVVPWKNTLHFPISLLDIYHWLMNSQVSLDPLPEKGILAVAQDNKFRS